MNSDIVTIEELKDRRLDTEPHFNIWALCLKCSKRWIGTVHYMTSLFTLECPECKSCDSFAAVIPGEYLEAHGVDNESIIASIEESNHSETPNG